MANATSLTPPSPELSVTLFSNTSVKSYSPKRPENVKPTTLYQCTGRRFRAAKRHRGIAYMHKLNFLQNSHVSTEAQSILTKFLVYKTLYMQASIILKKDMNA